jgi:hypothetical protein
MRDDEMDRDLADEFRAIRSEYREGTARLEGKIDALQQTLTTHAIEDARLFQKVGDIASTAHRRVDDANKRIDGHLAEHTQTRQGLFSLWVGVGIAFLSSVLAWIFSIVKGGKP